MSIKCECGAEYESAAELTRDGQCPRCLKKLSGGETSAAPPPPPLVPPAFSVPPAPPGQAGAHRRMLRMILLGFAVGGLVVMLVCGGLAALIAYSIAQANKQEVPVVNCQTNLMAIHAALSLYADEHQDKLPPLPSTSGRLMFEASTVYPEYINESRYFTCPSQEGAADRLARNDVSLVDDSSYIYLSHAVMSEVEGLVLIEAYDAAKRESRSLGEDLPVGPGEGTNGTSTLYALKKGVARLVAEDPLDSADVDWLTSQIPVLIERPGHHSDGGGNVIYLDGHAEYVELGDFPMLPGFINGLNSVAVGGSADRPE